MVKYSFIKHVLESLSRRCVHGAERREIGSSLLGYGISKGKRHWKTLLAAQIPPLPASETPKYQPLCLALSMNSA